MAGLSQLPVECLEQILRCITKTPPAVSRPALYALCRVNRHISRVATPLLYQIPFYLLTDMTVYTDRGHRSRCLLATLLANVPSNQIHPALLLARDIITDRADPNITTVSPNSVNHLLHIRHLNITTYTFLEYDAGGEEHKHYTPLELEYIYGQEFLEMYLADRKDATCLRDAHSKKRVLHYYLNVLYREATWSLAKPILEQLESLSFPLSDIRRYLQNVDRLARLERVHVYLDMVFSCECCDATDIPQEPRRLRKKEVLRDFVQFVKAHIKHFPGRLKTVNTSDSYFWEEGLQSCPDEVEQEIYKMLPSQYQPTFISESNWRKVAAHLETIDLSRVWQIKWLPPGEIVALQRVLQRCRTLCWFTVRSLPRDCFAWAVQEKMEIGRLDQGHVSTTTTLVVSPAAAGISPDRQQHMWSESTFPEPAHMQPSLVKLERLILEECRVPSRDLDAVIFAFSQSIKMIKIEALHGPENVQSIHIGRDWCTLSTLGVLELKADTYRLILDPLLFTRCPRLKRLRIKDETFEYSCEDVVPCTLAHVMELSEVYLRGWNALTFHPATLESTEELLVLKLSMSRQAGYCFLPPIGELSASYGLGSDAVPASIARPQWTWDWYLPRLVDIDLTSEFAYMFEFRMLHGCPALKTLRLHMRTVDDHHTRTISEADLFVTCADGSKNRIVAPKLRKVYMNGCWVFESSSVLSQFLGRMFPAVERLTARGWGGVTVESIAEVLRTAAGHVRM
ncbi:hypothetical protein BG015_009867, partial [Linnemannia schmuckeri]